jgi:hypothetical protein
MLVLGFAAEVPFAHPPKEKAGAVRKVATCKAGSRSGDTDHRQYCKKAKHDRIPMCLPHSYVPSPAHI